MKKLGKIASVAGSLLMGASLIAAAVPYTDGSADVAIIYGTNAAQTDTNTATELNAQALTALASVSGSGATTVSGTDSYKFEKTSTKFNLGDTITGVISSSLDDDELPTLLADGKFIDNDNDEFDYTQKITMTTSQLTMFENNDYKEDVPTVGFQITSGTHVLNYTLDFSDEPLVLDLATTDLPFMGKTYYVLSNTTSSGSIVLTLLDSASDTVLEEGASTTLNVDGTSYDVSVAFISSTEVKLEVNGETTNTLGESETYKLSDGSYVGIKDILYNSKDTGISSVEFSIGSGKLTLTGDASTDVKINDDTISGLTSYIINSTGTGTSGKLSSIALQWNADDDLFVTEDSEITMPGFEAVKLSFGGLNYPTEEVIEVEQGGNLYATLKNFPLKDGAADIDFLYGVTAGTFVGFGKDADDRLVTAADGANLTFDKDTDNYFVASWSDGSDAESYLMRATNFVLDGTDNKTDFQYYKDGSWTDVKTGAKASDTFSIGSVEVSVHSTNRLGKSVVIINNSANTNFNELWSEEGMKVQLPFVSTNGTTEGAWNFSSGGLNGSAGHNATSFYLVMREEDKNGNKAHADGDWINLTIGWDSSSPAEVEVSDYATETNADAGANGEEIEETDVFRDFTYSALATEILNSDPSSGQNSLKVIYHGDEVTADVYITSADATVGSVGDKGSMAIADSESGQYADANWIVVGGNCVNSVAASLLQTGAGECAAAFETATGAGAGEFVLKEVTRSNGKMALVVAGYAAADTVKAGLKVLNEDPADGVYATATNAIVTSN